jgi:hypothetical protein
MTGNAARLTVGGQAGEYGTAVDDLAGSRLAGSERKTSDVADYEFC